MHAFDQTVFEWVIIAFSMKGDLVSSGQYWHNKNCDVFLFVSLVGKNQIRYCLPSTIKSSPSIEFKNNSNNNSESSTQAKMTYQTVFIDQRLHNVHVNTARGVDQIERYAKERAQLDPVEQYEHEFVQRTNSLKSDIHGQLDSVHSEIISRRPSPHDADYSQKTDRYKKFLQYADSGMTGMRSVFASLFAKLFEVIKKIVKWIIQNLPQIFSAIAVLFKTVIVPLIFSWIIVLLAFYIYFFRYIAVFYFSRKARNGNAHGRCNIFLTDCIIIFSIFKGIKRQWRFYR